MKRAIRSAANLFAVIITLFFATGCEKRIHGPVDNYAPTMHSQTTTSAQPAAVASTMTPTAAPATAPTSVKQVQFADQSQQVQSVSPPPRAVKRMAASTVNQSSVHNDPVTTEAISIFEEQGFISTGWEGTMCSSCGDYHDVRVVAEGVINPGFERKEGDEHVPFDIVLRTEDAIAPPGGAFSLTAGAEGRASASLMSGLFGRIRFGGGVEEFNDKNPNESNTQGYGTARVQLVGTSFGRDATSTGTQVPVFGEIGGTVYQDRYTIFGQVGTKDNPWDTPWMLWYGAQRSENHEEKTNYTAHTGKVGYKFYGVLGEGTSVMPEVALMWRDWNANRAGGKGLKALNYEEKPGFGVAAGPVLKANVGNNDQFTIQALFGVFPNNTSINYEEKAQGKSGEYSSSKLYGTIYFTYIFG